MFKRNPQPQLRILYISWRRDIGTKRYIIAFIKRKASGYELQYKQEVKGAREEGLDHFPGFPDIEKTYTDNVIETLSLRLISKERPDRDEFLKFWEASGINDPFDLLGYTQGKSPTDNFEFLAQFYPTRGLKFVTDLSRLPQLKINKDFVKPGDELTFRHENVNSYDHKAIAIYKGNTKVGYIKKIHNLVFHHASKGNFKISVKSVDQNGLIRQIFVKVEY